MLAFILVLLAVALAAAAYVYSRRDTDGIVLDTPALQTQLPVSAPNTELYEVVDGYSNIWDIVFINNDTALFDERSGKLHLLDLRTSTAREIGSVPNVLAQGEGGLLGLALDSDFETNRYAYACYNHNATPRSVRVARFKLDTEAGSATEFTDIIPDIQSQAGRHSGCRIAMDTNGHLWVGTGDSAIGSAPQNPDSLAGKVLRVDRDGNAVEGNAPEPFDARIYNYGHRNIQGLVLFGQPREDGAIGFVSEHGPDKQDEINLIRPGNFGWNPDGSGSRYNESVPMTDLGAYPGAIPAVWNSGDQTIAVAGIEILSNERWQAWQNWVAMATLKGKHLRLLDIADDGSVRTELEIVKDQGRLRAVRQAPDGNLYITTDNGGGDDGILRLSTE